MSEQKEKLKDFIASHFVGLGVTLMGGVLGIAMGAAIGYSQTLKKNMDLRDVDRDGFLDSIVDENWKIILVNNPSLVKTQNPLYKICSFPKETKIPYSISTEDFSTATRPLLEECLKKY